MLMKTVKLFAAVLAAAMVLSLAGCGEKDTALNDADNIFTPLAGEQEAEAPDTADSKPDTGNAGAHILKLNGTGAALDGEELKEFDYTWKFDPSMEEPEFTGTEPDAELAAYIAHDVIYYPEIAESEFVKEKYDGEQEWVTRYTAEGLEDYIFATLPVLGNELPAEMMHSAEDAYDNPVIHINQPGEYIIEGSFNGQLFFDFGDEDGTFADKDASVKVILNGTDVTCSVAPAIVFHNVYECDNTWEDREEYTDETDLSEAGVKIVLADGTENNFTGCNVYRLLKPEYKKNSTSVQKKLWKTDAAFYSFRSMEINGEEKGTGILNVTSTTFEGLDSELHMTIDGGYVNVFSQDDGINVNEDHVSVFTMNGGRLTIFASLGSEGDVIDSNGFIRVNGGVIAGTSKSPSDELLDSEDGTYISDDARIIYGGSMSSGGRFGMPGGMRPERPDGTQPEMPDWQQGDPGQPPQWNPEGTPPEMPEGTPPEMPEGISSEQPSEG